MEEREVTSVEDVEEILTPATPTRTTEETKMDRLMEMFLQMEERRKAVSYTHLDVYKRQI